jgi:hypothetical protein
MTQRLAPGIRLRHAIHLDVGFVPKNTRVFRAPFWQLSRIGATDKEIHADRGRLPYVHPLRRWACGLAIAGT